METWNWMEGNILNIESVLFQHKQQAWKHELVLNNDVNVQKTEVLMNFILH